MRNYLSHDIEIIERGALDHFDQHELQQFAPDAGMFELATRLRDGQEIIIGKEKIMPLIEEAVSDLNHCGSDIILLLCNGEFETLASNCLIIQPQNLINRCVEGILDYNSTLGVLVPVQGQVDWVRASFEVVVKKTVVAVASPYSRQYLLENACATFRDAKCDLIVLYCMGFNQVLGSQVRHMSNCPVIVSSSMVSRAISELLTNP
jgi:protein AroM